MVLSQAVATPAREHNSQRVCRVTSPPAKGELDCLRGRQSNPPPRILELLRRSKDESKSTKEKRFAFLFRSEFRSRIDSWRAREIRDRQRKYFSCRYSRSPPD